jgi:hypothetical protein
MSVYITGQFVKQNISHLWRTTIQETIEGGEKRTALYSWPRIGLENQMEFTTNAERYFIKAALFTDLHNTWFFPFIADKTELTASAASGQKILTVDETDYRHFYAGRQCILIDAYDWETYEYAEIDTVDSSTQITLVSNLTDTWGVGTKVFPLYEFRIKPEQSINFIAPDFDTIDIIADESFESLRTFSYSLPSSGVATYNGLDLFLTKPLVTGVKEKYRHPYTLLGFYGLEKATNLFGDTRRTLNRQFIFEDRESISDFMNFFDSKQGRLVSFYAPTWIEDITPTAAIDAANNSITIEKTYFTSAQLVGKHIYIKFPDGTYTCKEITARPLETLITLDSAIGTSVLAADLSDVLICFLHEVRFGVDEAKMEYMKLGLARITLNLVEL